MKPIKLVMSAFGSYAGVTEIDFTKINKGIFLITGDTGSGKTTIFDAIVYALYDRTSTGTREPSDMRSQYAAADVQTYVEYTFLYDDKIYKIRRNPKYNRMSKRRDKDGNLKETTEQPSVELIMPDGKEFCGKLREVNEKIVDIIGLDAEQFTQIAMLAQGEFMKLLQASSNKRKEIFNRIFNTKIYSSLQEQLRQETKKRYIELDENKKLCEMELAAITPSEYTFTEAESQILLDDIKSLIEQNENKENIIKNDVNDIQQKTDELIALQTSMEHINRILQQLKAEYEQKHKLSQEGEKINGIKYRLEKAQKAQKVSVADKKCQSSRHEIEEINKRIKINKNKLKQFEEQLMEYEVLKNQIMQKRQQQEPVLQKQLTAIEQELPLYEELEIHKNKLSIQKKELDKKIAEEIKIQKSIEKKQSELVMLHKKAVENLNEYQRLNDEFISEQAGIMASTLSEGNPCPVCGSVTHPKKAVISKKDISQTLVNEAKKNWQNADKKETECSTSLMEMNKELETISMQKAVQLAEYEASKAKMTDIQSKLGFDTKAEAVQQQKALQEKLENIKNKEKEAQIQYQNVREEITQLEGKNVTEQEQKQRFEESLAIFETELELSLKIQGFDNVNDYKTALSCEEEIEKLQNELDNYAKAQIRNDEAVNQLQKQLQEADITADEDIKNVKLSDTAKISNELEQLRIQKKQLENEQQTLYAVKKRNEEAYDKLVKLYERRTKLKSEYELYNNLDKTANGNLSGSAKLDFQTYIQRRYFETIVQAANKRLIKMSSNQFILQCRSFERLGSQGAVGLELDVYSLVNDKTRDVKTLSGGESFMAALSMALGMADVIQNTAGKIKLNTMFVDEGFGSLDENSISEAIKILQELAGNDNLIGIISHIKVLKEEIDSAFFVQKDESGSRVFSNG